MARDVNARYRDDGMDRPGHNPGISERWETEAGRAEQSGDKFDMGDVWLDETANIRTLKLVRRCVSEGYFSPADLKMLEEEASTVVKQMEEDSRRVESNGRADPEHLKTLEEWKGIVRSLQVRRSRPGAGNQLQHQGGNGLKYVFICCIVMCVIAFAFLARMHVAAKR